MKELYSGTDEKGSQISTKIIRSDDVPGLGNYQMIEYPTGNCQLYSLYNAKVILQLPIAERKAEFYKIWKAFQMRSLVLIDIQVSYESKVEEIFPKQNILVKSNYNSSNGSSMMLYLINQRNLIEKWKQ